MDALRTCLSIDAVRKALTTLPKTLDATYERILNSIDDDHRAKALSLLQWLAFSCRPMRLEEIAEAISMADEDQPVFNPTKRLFDPIYVLSFCTSLVAWTKRWAEYGKQGKAIYLRLAHFSVKEYLLSQRIPANFRIEEFSSYLRFAKTCLAYLLHLDFHLPRAKAFVDYPMLRYAAIFWAAYAKAIPDGYSDTLLNQMILKLFDPDKLCHQNFLNAYDPGRLTLLKSKAEEVVSPLYYASILGLLDTTRALINSGVDISAQGGSYGNALQAAASSGEERVVQLLLDSGANVNARGGYSGNALQAAASSGNETVVQLLLDAGAHVNTQGGRYGNALQASTTGRSETMTRLLLDAGAKVNAQGGYYGTALQAAADSGSEIAIQLLLAAGADVNAQGGKHGSSLHAAIRRGNMSAIHLLLDAGADVNVQEGSLIRAAAMRLLNSEYSRKLSIEGEAGVYIQDGIHGRALKPALTQGYQKTIDLLIANGLTEAASLELGSDSWYFSDFDWGDRGSEAAGEDHARLNPALGALPSAIYYYYVLQDSAYRSVRQSLLFFRVIWNWVKLHFCAAVGALVASFWSALL